jgi:hypothetical protein
MKNYNKLFTWLMIIFCVIGVGIVFWGFLGDWVANNALASETILNFAYIMIVLAVLSIIVGVVIGGMHDPKSLMRLGISLLIIAAICFVVYLIAPGTPAQGLITEQPSDGVLKLTDTVLYLAYILSALAVVAIIVGELRIAIKNRK